LGEIAKFSKGKGISKKDVIAEGSQLCVRYGELYTMYNEQIKKVFSKTTFSEDLVLSEGNEVLIPSSGETAIDIATASCVTIPNVALGGDINIIKSDMNGVFLALLIRGASKIQLARKAQGISVVHLYAKHISELQIKTPSLPEQKKIADFLTTIDEQIKKVTSQIEHMKTWKRGLLQKMFV